MRLKWKATPLGVKGCSLSSQLQMRLKKKWKVLLSLRNESGWNRWELWVKWDSSGKCVWVHVGGGFVCTVLCCPCQIFFTGILFCKRRYFWEGEVMFVGESELPGANEGTTVFFFYTADIIHTHTNFVWFASWVLVQEYMWTFSLKYSWQSQYILTCIGQAEH